MHKLFYSENKIIYRYNCINAYNKLFFKSSPLVDKKQTGIQEFI